MILSADILPAGRAFESGKLEMSDSLNFDALAAASPQTESIITSVFMVVFVAIVIFSLRNLIKLLPDLISCYTRKSSCLALEHNVQTSSDRNLAAFALLLPFCLIADRLDLYRPQWLLSVPHGWMSLIALGVGMLYVLLRILATSIVRRPYHIQFDAWMAVKRCYLSYFILAAVLVAATAGLLSLFGVAQADIRRTAYWEMAVIYFLSFVRNGQILGEYCGGFGTILYLCALEIIPTGALIASAVLL